MKKHFVILLVSILYSGLHAQELNFFKTQEANDIIASQNLDRYFTQGLNFELMSGAIGKLYKKIKVSHLLPALKNDTLAVNHYSVSVSQELYTPKDKTADTVVRNDRPYAGTLFFTAGNIAVSQQHNQRIKSNLSIGIMGPAALGKTVQNGVHLLFSKNNTDTNITGWNYQLHNDLYLNYLLQYNHLLVRTKYMEMSTAYQFNIGTIHDDFGIGGNLRAGIYKSYYDHNLGYINSANRNRNVRTFIKNAQLYLFFNPTVRIVLYNALLQGGLINNIIGTAEHRLSENEISRFIADGNYGIAMVLGRFSIQFVHYFKSREFNDGYNHRYGNLVFVYSW